MWVLKGSALGLAIFFVLSLLFVINAMRPFEAGKATGLSVIAGVTVHNGLWYLALVGSLALGWAILGSWPTRTH